MSDIFLDEIPLTEHDISCMLQKTEHDISCMLQKEVGIKDETGERVKRIRCVSWAIQGDDGTFAIDMGIRFTSPRNAGNILSMG